jgi:hypothetical protein
VQLKGSLELTLDKALLAAPMRGIINERQESLIARRASLEIANSGLHREAKAGADVEGFEGAERSPHDFCPAV